MARPSSRDDDPGRADIELVRARLLADKRPASRIALKANVELSSVIRFENGTTLRPHYSLIAALVPVLWRGRTLGMIETPTSRTLAVIQEITRKRVLTT